MTTTIIPAERQPLLPRLESDADPSNVVVAHDGSSSSTNAADAASASSAALPWAAEYRLVLRYSFPLIGTYLLAYAFQLVIVLVASQLSTGELAGVSLGITTSNIIGYAVFEGMATAMDTLCSQAYGAAQYQLVGLHCIKFSIFIHLAAAPILTLWVLSPQLMRYLVPSEQLAVDAGTFLRFSAIGVPGYALFEVGKRFMQAQGNFNAGLYVLILCLPFSVAFNWLFVFRLQWRVAGAALAAALSNAIRPILLLGYILLVDRDSLQCWPAKIDKSTLFSDWATMVRLSIPGVVMTLSEWFSFEVLTFATSYVGTAELAAQTFLSTAAVIAWHIPFSCSVAVTTRIGHLVGGGWFATAKTVATWYAWLFIAVGVFNVGLVAGILVAVVRYLAMDDDVRTIVAGATLLVAIFCFFDSLNNWAHGVFRALGWQTIAGWVTIFANYLDGVPLALLLMLGPPRLGVNAIYLGIGSALIIQTVIGVIVLKQRSWESAALYSTGDQA